MRSSADETLERAGAFPPNRSTTRKSAPAAGTASGPEASRRDSWTIDSGLPHNSVNTIVQTRDGYLWHASKLFDIHRQLGSHTVHLEPRYWRVPCPSTSRHACGLAGRAQREGFTSNRGFRLYFG